MDQEIVDYILQAQKHGLSDFEIKQNLLGAGWDAAMVEKNFTFAKATENKTANLPESQPVQRERPQISPVHGPIQTLQVSDIQQQQASVTPAVTSVQNIEAEKKPRRRSIAKIIVPVIVVLVLLGGGAYAYYNFLGASPQKVWDNYLVSKKPTTFTSNYAIAYTDSTIASSTLSADYSLSGVLKTDASDPANVKMSNDINLGLSAGGINFNIKLSYLLLGQVIYIDIGQIPQVQAMLGPQYQNAQWLKIDIQSFENYLKQEGLSTNSPNIYNQADLVSKLSAIWQNAKIVTPTGSAVKETLNGVAVYHITNKFDPGALQQAISQTFDTLATESSSTTLTNQQKGYITAIINRLQVKQFDVWIGQKDGQLYKFHLVINAPTIQDLSNASLAQAVGPLAIAQEKSREAKRLADVRQIGTALELYFNDHNGYPAASGGLPQGIAPTYIGAFESAPEPADGTCTDYYNGYWYKPAGKAENSGGQTVYPSYTLTFCLGSATGGYQAGIGELTETGIKDNIPCPTTPDLCIFSGQRPTDDITPIINAMSFGAQLSLDSSYSGFGQPLDLQAPANSLDVLGLIKNSAPNNLQSSQSQAQFDTSNVTPISQPRPVDSTDHTLGPANAKNIFIEYTDFQCPACATYNSSLEQIPSMFNNTELVFRYYTLTQIHPNSAMASYAAEAAGAQGKFWQMNDLLFANQTAWAGLADPLTEFAQLAKTAGVANIQQFENDVTTQNYKQNIQTDLTEALGLNLAGVPTFYFNGHQLQNTTIAGLEKQMQQYYQK